MQPSAPTPHSAPLPARGRRGAPRAAGLVLILGLVVGLYSACQLATSAPTSPPAGTVGSFPTCAQRNPPILTGDDFAATVRFVSGPYDPSGFGAPPRGAPVGAPYFADLSRAFTNAPPAFRDQLCGLDGVFIDQTPCGSFGACEPHSWGFRGRLGGTGRYVGLTAGLWTAAVNPTYAQFETALLQTLLPPTLLGVVSYGAANSGADTFAMSVLASLAHETGHVRWFDLLDPNRTGTQNPGNLPCFFTSWPGGGAGFHAPPWRELLTPAGRRRGGISIAIDRAPNAQVAGDLLDKIYEASAPWASFFASISPDEDFVETYKFKVLTTANPVLTSLPITMPGTHGGHTENIPADYRAGRKTELTSKTACIPATL